jgi:hypothetical protein
LEVFVRRNAQQVLVGLQILSGAVLALSLVALFILGLRAARHEGSGTGTILWLIFFVVVGSASAGVLLLVNKAARTISELRRQSQQLRQMVIDNARAKMAEKREIETVPALEEPKDDDSEEHRTE